MIMDLELTPKAFDEFKMVEENADYRVSIMPVSALEDVWPYLDAWLDAYPNLWNRIHTKDTIRQFLELGKFTLWLVSKDGFIKLAFMTTVAPFPLYNALFVVWAVGENMAEWLELSLSAVETIAAQQDISAIYIEGREGWRKPIAKYGYQYVHAVYGKFITSKRVN